MLNQPSPRAGRIRPPIWVAGSSSVITSLGLQIGVLCAKQAGDDRDRWSADGPARSMQEVGVNLTSNAERTPVLSHGRRCVQSRPLPGCRSGDVRMSMTSPSRSQVRITSFCSAEPPSLLKLSVNVRCRGVGSRCDRSLGPICSGRAEGSLVISAALLFQRLRRNVQIRRGTRLSAHRRDLDFSLLLWTSVAP